MALTFVPTGAPQTLIVPLGVTELAVRCVGGAGSKGASTRTPGGPAEVTATIPVTPGETLYIFVGGNGGTGVGGYNGGGAASGQAGGGGGATDIRRGGTTLAHRILVAGGSGGNGASVPGSPEPGAAGGAAALNGASGGGGFSGPGGGGGTQTAGGAGGTSYSDPATRGADGSLGAGGRGSNAGSLSYGGGGGGGLYGGGGGGTGLNSWGAGGGGGSSLVPVGGTVATLAWSSAPTGLVEIGNIPPHAPTLIAPADGATIDVGAVARFVIQHNDPDPGDTQSALRLRYRAAGVSGWTDTGWVATPNNYYDVAPGTFTAGLGYEWQAATKDSQGVAGPFSASSFFTAAESPDAPPITAPTNGATIGTAEYAVTWSTPDQDAYQLRVLDEGDAVVYDTGTVASPSARSHLVPYPDNGVTRTTQVRVQHEGLWSEWGQVTNPVSYTPPPAPAFTLELMPSVGALAVRITNPAPTGSQPALSHNEVEVDDDDGEGFKPRYGSRAVGGNGLWHYWLPRAGVDYTQRVRVTAVGVNGTRATTTGTA